LTPSVRGRRQGRWSTASRVILAVSLIALSQEVCKINYRFVCRPRKYTPTSRIQRVLGRHTDGCFFLPVYHLCPAFRLLDWRCYFIQHAFLVMQLAAALFPSSLFGAPHSGQRLRYRRMFSPSATALLFSGWKQYLFVPGDVIRFTFMNGNHVRSTSFRCNSFHHSSVNSSCRSLSRALKPRARNSPTATTQLLDAMRALSDEMRGLKMRVMNHGQGEEGELVEAPSQYIAGSSSSRPLWPSLCCRLP
jgi:hypothetical protein